LLLSPESAPLGAIIRTSDARPALLAAPELRAPTNSHRRARSSKIETQLPTWVQVRIDPFDREGIVAGIACAEGCDVINLAAGTKVLVA
jgi:hypothetical protein